MAQFHAYHNPNKATRATYPYLLDIQSDLLEDLRTTVVVPLSPASVAAVAAIGRLNPVLELDGNRYVALIPQMAGIERRHLGRYATNLSEYRSEIVAALDFLISGI